MKIMCTGTTGFIGTNLVFKLLAAKHVVALLKRKTSSLHILEQVRNDIIIYDYTTYTDIQNAITDFMPDVVIHLATLYINRHKVNDIPQLIESNILFGTQLLEAMKNSGVQKFINFGTRWQHVDNTFYNPANLYAATKQAFFDMLLWYMKNGISAKTLELCDTFGKYDTRKKIVNLMIEACKDKKHLDLSPGEQILDMVFIDHVINYLLKNIGNDGFFDNTALQLIGSEIKLKDLGCLIETLSGVTGFLRWGEKPYRNNEVMTPPLSSGIASHILKADLAEDIKQCFFS